MVRRQSGYAIGCVAFVMTILAANPVAWGSDDGIERCASDAEAGARLLKAGRLSEARTRISECTQNRCPEIVANDCVDLAARLEAEQPTVVFRVTLDGHDCRASVQVDGRLEGYVDGRATALDPGPHVLSADCGEGGNREQRDVMLLAGEKLRTIAFDLRTPRVRVAPIVIGAIGVGALAAGSVFGVSALTTRSRLLDTCSPRCSDDQTEPMKVDAAVADVLLGTGVVLLATSAYLWFSTEGQRARHSRL